MLFRSLRIDESTKSNTLCSISLGTGRLLANGFQNLLIHYCMFSEQQFLSPLLKNSEKLPCFVAFRFFKNDELSDFGTQLVPTTSELILPNSTSYFSAVTM